MFPLAAAALIGYLLGSIPVGFLVAKSKGLDIRQYGSGATGGTNVLRTVGPAAAIATGVLDLLKGTVAAYLGSRMAGDWGYAAAVLAAMLGHSYPIWLGFRGGKAVATGAGGVLLHHPLAVGLGLATALAFIVPTRYVSLGSMTGAAVLGLWLIMTQPPPGQVLGAGALAIVLWRHRSNISRLIAGTENKFGQPAGPRGRG